MTNSRAPGTPDGLRVGDAERDAVALALHEHFAAGRLDRAELDERLDAALAAKTLGDLRDVVRDLPEPNGLPMSGREAVTSSSGHGPYGGRGPHERHPGMWAGAGHPAWRGHRRRPPFFPVLAVLFAAVALSTGAGAGSALLTVFHVVVILWIVRMLAMLVHTRRHRGAPR
ncbi:DUF1707 domain-containing protein [Spirillospora sp. NPDC052269]